MSEVVAKPMTHEEVIRQYKEDFKFAQDAFVDFKLKMTYAREAFLNEIPADIKGAASNEIYMQGYTTDQPVRDSRAGNMKKSQALPQTCSKMLLPMYKAIAKKMIDNMTAIPPRYEWDANRKDYVKTSRSLEKEFAKFYTKMNLAGKMPRIIKHFVRDGVFVQQTVFKEMSEQVMKWTDGRPNAENLYNKGAIDYLIYDPMTCYFDWDADPMDYRGTARFIIVTISSSMSQKAFRRKYPNFKGSIGGGHQEREDLLKDQSGDRIVGKTKPNNVVVLREYYLDNGKFYVIADDAHVVDEGWSSNGDLSRIPINVGFCYDEYITLWEELKWPVAAMSNSFNQVADNNAFNNTSPIYVLGDVVVDPLAYDPADGRKMFRIDPMSKQIVRAADALHQFTIPEVTQGATFMYEKAKEALFYVTGTTDMTFGMQDKQIRIQSVADMIGEALIRSDSDIAKRIENSFYNPVTWDILRIFYTRYDSFDFKDQNIPADFLKDYRNIRVVNGSYLPADRMVRLAKLNEALKLAVQIPDKMNLENLFFDLFEAIGFVDPYRYLMTDEEYWAKELAGTVMMLLQTGAIDKASADSMLKAIQLIEQNKEQIQEKNNG